MQNNYKCYNLTQSTIQFRLDGINYHMLPKGMSNPETNLHDWCIVTPEHAVHSAFQAFALSNPPKVRLVPLKKLDNAADMEKVLNKAMDESLTKINHFQTQLDNLLRNKEKHFNTAIKDVYEQSITKLSEVNSAILGVAQNLKKLEEQIKEVSEKGIGTDKVDHPSRSRNKRTSASDLFNK